MGVNVVAKLDWGPEEMVHGWGQAEARFRHHSAVGREWETIVLCTGVPTQ